MNGEEIILKIVECWAAYNAATGLESDAEMKAINDALSAELTKAAQLESRFYAEFNDEEHDAGMCNARDTMVETGAYRMHETMVEKSSEFWDLAIRSAQAFRDLA